MDNINWKPLIELIDNSICTWEKDYSSTADEDCVRQVWEGLNQVLKEKPATQEDNYKAMALAQLLGESVDGAIRLIEQYGMIDGGHHKQWLLDQILRVLLAEHYDGWVQEYNAYENSTYLPWDIGIAP